MSFKNGEKTKKTDKPLLRYRCRSGILNPEAIHMWLIMAVLSAVFAGLTSILAKCGIQKTDSDVATAIRTFVVLLFSVLMTFLVGSFRDIGAISAKSLLFLVLSGNQDHLTN